MEHTANHTQANAPALMPDTLDPALSRHPGFTRMFKPGHMTLGLMHPLESYAGSVATMQGQIPLAQRAEALGFAALWLRDVPLHDPYFGDAGQIYDTWVYAGWLAAQTRTVSIATGAVVLPLRHPLHVAKAAASIDQLSQGRLVLGVASGDRPLEYPAFNADFDTRGERFRDSLAYLHDALEHSFPVIDSPLGRMAGDIDLLPKPYAARIPILITGASRQSPQWLAGHADGWLQYFRPPEQIARLLSLSRGLAQEQRPGIFVPYTQGFGLDLAADPDALPRPIHNGLAVGRHWLGDFLEHLRELGVNHVLFGLKYGHRPADEVIDELGEHIVPRFAVHAAQPPNTQTLNAPHRGNGQD